MAFLLLMSDLQTNEFIVPTSGQPAKRAQASSPFISWLLGVLFSILHRSSLVSLQTTSRVVSGDPDNIHVVSLTLILQITIVEVSIIHQKESLKGHLQQSSFVLSACCTMVVVEFIVKFSHLIDVM